MNFRDESNLKPKVLNSSTATGLESQILLLGLNHDLIDLQYSVAYDVKTGYYVYSALALVREK